MRPTPKRHPCVGLLFCALAGIVLGHAFPCNLPIALFAAFCLGITAFLSRRAFPCFLLIVAVFLIRQDLDWHEAPGRIPVDLLTQGVTVLRATGVVTNDPALVGTSARRTHSRFEMRVTGLAFNGRVIKSRFPVQVYWSGPAPQWGDKVAMTASIGLIPPPRNPGEFDYAAYLARKGIFAELSCDYPEDERIIAHGKGNRLVAWARDCRTALQRRIILGIADDPEIAGIVQTISLGVKQEISPVDRDLFQHVGALHLFVVNGLHIALLAGILRLLLKPFGIHRRAFALVIIPILFAYALVTGLNPGSVRAAIMAAVLFGAGFVERRPFSFNTLAAAALILLAWNTNDLFQEGFQFSFGVVIAIMFLAGFFERLILPVGVPDPYLPRSLWTPVQNFRNYCWRNASSLAGVSVAASIGSFPFSAGYFNLVTPSGLLANLLLVPIAFGILAEAVFSLLSSFAGWIALLFNNANWMLAWLMLAVVHFFAFLPGGHFYVASHIIPERKVTILDLSPGQAILIQDGGSAWLVDCGNSSSYSRSVAPFLQYSGINRLDGLILTRNSTSSMGGVFGVIADFAPAKIIEPAQSGRSPARVALDKAGLSMTHVKAGDEIELASGITCSVLYPPANLNRGNAADKSLVLCVKAGGTTIVLMSDSGYAGEQWLLENDHNLRASIVVLGGQSSDIAGTNEFISAIHPFAAIRGAPGFAAPESWNRYWSGNLVTQGVTPFLQAETGAVTINLTQSGAEITGFINGRHLDHRN